MKNSKLEGQRSRKKRRKEDDRISRSCDAIIHHILSFLPVKDAARTCILSKRWRNLWASTPVIDFDSKFFERTALGRQPGGSLLDFMSGAILCREKAPINILRMSFDYKSKYYFTIKQWIQISLRYNVQEISLDFRERSSIHQCHSLNSIDSLQDYYCDDENDIRTPRRRHYSSSDSEYSDYSDSDRDEPGRSCFTVFPILFTYGFLRVLQLKGCKITHEGPMEFRSLTSLVLTYVHISDNVLQKILSGCSLLQNLELRAVSKLEHLEFSFLKLQRMKLECCHHLREVTLEAQELKYFKYSAYHILEVMFLDFPALMKAEIGLCHNFNSYHDKANRDKHMADLLKCFSRIEDLTLYSHSIGDLMGLIIPKDDMEGFSLSKIRRFEMIGRMDYRAIRVISESLEALDNLESLTLTFVQPMKQMGFEYSEEGRLRELKNASIRCLRRHLKELKVCGFGGNVLEIKIVEILLAKAKVLENIDIRTYTSSHLTHQEIKARLLSCCSSQDAKSYYG